MAQRRLWTEWMRGWPCLIDPMYWSSFRSPAQFESRERSGDALSLPVSRRKLAQMFVCRTAHLAPRCGGRLLSQASQTLPSKDRLRAPHNPYAEARSFRRDGIPRCWRFGERPGLCRDLLVGIPISSRIIQIQYNTVSQKSLFQKCPVPCQPVSTWQVDTGWQAHIKLFLIFSFLVIF